nr:glycosyltransferase family 4 protein [uncultured Lichenicoccus sp.]
MRILVWQWGRRGAGPRMAAELAAALRALPGHTVFLSLSGRAEILRASDAPTCALPVATYAGGAGYVGRMLLAPVSIPWLMRRLRGLAPEVAICAMPGPLDLLMAMALQRLRIPMVVTVHDADLHPGDGLPLQMPLQRALIRRATALVALTGHVAARLRQQPAARGLPLLEARLPPLVFQRRCPPAPLAHGGPLRLLCFGRLLPYKGLDLFEAALRGLASVDPAQGGATQGRFEVRVVGEGPDTPTLAALGRLPGVSVENRWVPEDEVGSLVAWADAVVLPYREASQSGVAAIALAAGRWVVATRVGGLLEQFRGEAMALLCEPEATSIGVCLMRLLDDPPPPPPVAPDPLGLWLEMARSLSRQIEPLLPGAVHGRHRVVQDAARSDPAPV